MVLVNANLLQTVLKEAVQSPRLRMNHNFHKVEEDRLQHFLNCMEANTYCQPHRHLNPPKREIFIILEGKVLVVEFDDMGKVTHHNLLCHENKQYAAIISPGTWHTIIALEPGTAMFEIKDGPYSPVTDKDFAPWAPREGNKDCQKYNESIKRMLLS